MFAQWIKKVSNKQAMGILFFNNSIQKEFNWIVYFLRRSEIKTLF